MGQMLSIEERIRSRDDISDEVKEELVNAVQKLAMDVYSDAFVTQMMAKFDSVDDREPSAKRSDIDTLDSKIDTLGATLDSGIDTLGTTLDSRIDTLGATLDGRIDTLDSKIDTLGTTLDGRIDTLAGRIDTLATREDLAKEVAKLATREEVKSAISELKAELSWKLFYALAGQAGAIIFLLEILRYVRP